LSESKDDIEIARYEQAISRKYGKESVQTPLSTWDDEKEQQYLEQSAELYLKQQKIQEQKDKIEIDGFLLSKKLINKDTNRICPVCSKYSFDLKDDVYMSKFDCCFHCHVQWVENREERWKSGWRPKKTKKASRSKRKR